MDSTRACFAAVFSSSLIALLAVGCSCGGPPDPGDAGVDAAPFDANPADASRERCGNGLVEGAEACDDGNTDPDDGCAADCTLECGDGLLSGAELCDTAIADGEAGACPTACDDMDTCTTDALDGAGCTTVCSHPPITAPADGDMCCPPGADSTTDSDCVATCGNGTLETAETCDTAIPAGTSGACPTMCEDVDPCTLDALADSGTCIAFCDFTPITTAADGDMCCPPGETRATDSDCAIACGDGVVSAGETCDTAIAAGAPGACPTACDDSMVCTTDALVNAGTCDALCTSMAITAPAGGDGCCPPGATFATDSDCTATCGDGVVSGGESCDTAIAAGMAGACPTTCSDMMACTSDVLTGAGTCAATCSFPAVTTAVDADGCCPPAETIATDSDCPIACGDGVVSAGETCDTGSPGSCPSACDDVDPCTTDALFGAGTCGAICTTSPVAVGAMDACCPSGETIATDPDCTAVCGDGVITAPETCDDGNTVDGDGCSATCVAERVAFRFTDLDLMDPHVFAAVPILGCTDVTNLSFLGTNGINPLLEENIRLDGDGDGLLDLSTVQTFAPFVQAAGTMSASELVFPDCTAPMSSTSCTLPMGAMRTMATATNSGGGAVCLDVLAGTARPYAPVIRVPTAPGGGTCYVASAGTVTFNLGGIPITLEDSQIAGEWFGTPATGIRDGLLRGFLSEATADATIIPAGLTGIATIDGQPLSSLLRGGTSNCSEPSPMMGDQDTRMGASGWYFYLNFDAARVPYTEL